MQRGDTLQTPIYMKRSIPGEKDKFAVSYDFLLSRRVFLAWRGRCMIPIDCYWSQSQEVLFIKTIRQRQGWLDKKTFLFCTLPKHITECRFCFSVCTNHVVLICYYVQSISNTWLSAEEIENYYAVLLFAFPFWP